MTLTESMPTAPLVGKALIERLKLLGTEIRPEDAAKQCGHPDVESLQAAITQHATDIGLNIEEIAKGEAPELDISSLEQSLAADVTTFAVAAGWVMRRADTDLRGITEYSESDQKAHGRAIESWTRFYQKLSLTTYGCYAINTVKWPVIHFYAFNGPSDITILERLEYYTKAWDSLEQMVGGMNELGQLSDEVNDSLLAETSDYNKRIGFKGAGVLRTLYFDRWYERGFLNDPDEKQHFDKDVEYLSEQLTFLDHNTVPYLYEAFTLALASSAASCIFSDNFTSSEIISWANQELECICNLWPEGKPAEGKW